MSRFRLRRVETPFIVLITAGALATAVILPGAAAGDSGADAGTTRPAPSIALRTDGSSDNPRQECREERREHPSTFSKRYGTGAKAMQRCIRHERNDHD